MARAILKSRGIAKRINIDLVTTRNLGIPRQFLQKTDRRENARRLVPMYSGENTHAKIVATPAWSDKKILLQKVVICSRTPVPKRRRQP